MSPGVAASVAGDLGIGNPGQAFNLSTMLDSNPLFGSSGGCPGPVTFTALSRSYSLQFDCEGLHTLGRVIVGVSLIAAAYIVFRRS